MRNAECGVRNCDQSLLTSAATGLKWERHEGVAMKGFPGKWTLWAVAG